MGKAPDGCADRNFLDKNRKFVSKFLHIIDKTKKIWYKENNDITIQETIYETNLDTLFFSFSICCDAPCGASHVYGIRGYRG
jgi:hypothetical protein